MLLVKNEEKLLEVINKYELNSIFSQVIPSDDEEIARILSAFTEMQEKGMGIPSHTLRFLMRKI